MKTAIGFIASWTLFWMGHIVCKTCMTHWYVPKSYSVYNWLMLESFDAQNWGGKGPWRHCDGA